MGIAAAKTMAAAAIAAALALAPARAAEEPAAEAVDLRPAMRAAEAWLALVDAGRYGESWDEAAALFREAMPRVRWEVAVQQARESAGRLAARKLAAATFSTALPGAPPGEYVVIQYTSRFAALPRAVETVTPMREADGRWKVSGYYIRPAATGR